MPATLDALLSRQTVWRAGRAPIAALRGEPTGFDALDALLPQAGWPCAALTELLLPCDGVGELSLLLPTLARLTQAGGIVVLIAPPYVPYAPAWRDAGVDLAKLQIVEADPRSALWAFEQALRSGACAAVLGWPQRSDAQALRRLQVAAGSGDCLGFVFRDRKHAVNPSPAALRIEYVRQREREGEGAWHVRKCRGANAPVQAFVPGKDMARPQVEANWLGPVPASAIAGNVVPLSFAHGGQGDAACEPLVYAQPIARTAGASRSVAMFSLSPACGGEGVNRSGDSRSIATVAEGKRLPDLVQQIGAISAIASPGSPSPQPSHPSAGERECISVPSSAFAFASSCAEAQVLLAHAPISNPQVFAVCASPDAASP